MPSASPSSYANAARARIAAHGLRGLSMRTVAQDAGSSLGSLNYHIGDKAALVAELIGQEQRDQAALHAVWLRRGGALDLAAPGALAAVVTGYLDEAATERRDRALTRCELLLEAEIDPDGHAGLGSMIDAEEGFWVALLARDHGPRAQHLGRAVCAYCHDELPFSLAVGNNSDYRLLRSATVARLSAGWAGDGSGDGAGLALRFDALVAACGESPAGTPLPVDLPEGSRRAALAGDIARLILERGIASVSHRSVAARAGVSNSSVAHHFRTRDDLLMAGFGAMIQGMRRAIGPGASWSDAGMVLMRATHAIAIAAARDPALRPFALDMRRRRAENVRETIRQWLTGDAEGAIDGAAIQSASMVIIGSRLMALARGDREGKKALTVDQLAGLRRTPAQN